ncbi:MAG: hypothetical protein HRT66_04835, partial [Flavobacteriaceae bacterium]|nr:hypothetical protein [Flavobacteriaceae bacterium]
SVNNTEFEHLDGVTSDIQTQFSEKLNLSGGTVTGATSVESNLTLGKEGTTGVGTIVLRDDTATNSNTVTLKSPTSVGTSYNLTLPENVGADGEVLKTDGAGVLSWVTPSIHRNIPDYESETTYNKGDLAYDTNQQRVRRSLKDSNNSAPTYQENDTNWGLGEYQYPIGSIYIANPISSGTVISGWNVKLNQLGASNDVSVITLPKGKYLIEWVPYFSGMGNGYGYFSLTGIGLTIITPGHMFTANSTYSETGSMSRAILEISDLSSFTPTAGTTSAGSIEANRSYIKITKISHL